MPDPALILRLALEGSRVDCIAELGQPQHVVVQRAIHMARRRWSGSLTRIAVRRPCASISSLASARFCCVVRERSSVRTSVSGTPAWTLAGERGDLMQARDEKSARRYVFAAPGGSVIFVR